MGMVPSKDFPPCKVRRAITDEADNLVPLIERGQKRGLPLTDLPPSSHPDHPHAVARLISAQNKRDAVFAAEVTHFLREFFKTSEKFSILLMEIYIPHSMHYL
jgi:hypothetical protein